MGCHPTNTNSITFSTLGSRIVSLRIELHEAVKKLQFSLLMVPRRHISEF